MQTLPEIQQIESLVRLLGPAARTEVLAFSEKDGVKMPIYKITLGNPDPAAPVLGFVGGVHGLERIGSQVCVSLLHSLAHLVLWDESLRETLKKVRVFFIPTVNPIGIYRKTRANPRGVDLMRNAPVEAENPPRWVGGHRRGPRWPWFRGYEGEPMEVESQALVDAVDKEISQSSVAITLDVHSGFGFQDRVWFPYAKTIRPFPDLPSAYRLKELLDKTYPYHFYRFEPQAHSYTTHGDLWDYLYDRHRYAERSGLYMPLCLEMGSWMWVKKNPWQIFLADGPFNPMKLHRLRRILRRHNTLMEFLLRAVASPDSWAKPDKQLRAKWEEEAKELWYGQQP